jgi:hypothetical protein
MDSGSRDKRAQESKPTRLSILEPIEKITTHVSAEKREVCNLNAMMSEVPKGPSRETKIPVISLDNGGCAGLTLKTEKSPEAKPCKYSLPANGYNNSSGYK